MNVDDFLLYKNKMYAQAILQSQHQGGSASEVTSLNIYEVIGSTTKKQIKYTNVSVDTIKKYREHDIVPSSMNPHSLRR